MELKGGGRLAADRATAWTLLNDTEVLKACVPGCESIVTTGENQFEVAMTAAVGPVKAKFKGRLALADIDAPNGYTMKFDASGGPTGFARGEARVTLTEIAPRETQLDYVATVQVGGKLAQVGSRLIEAAAGATTDKFFEAFGVQLAARMAVPAEGVEPAAGPAPAPARVGWWSLLVAFLRRLFRGR